MKRAVLFLLAACLLVGCSEEEKITRTQRERLNEMQRMLAVIVPADEPAEHPSWFFKVVGPETQIEALKPDFDRFVESIRFTDPYTPTWKLPEDWIETKPQKGRMRYSTLRVGPDPKSPELTVTALLGENAGSVPDNVHRWRMQLGLTATLGIRDLEVFHHDVTIGNKVATVVDLLGPRAGKSPSMPKLALEFETPDGWWETTATDGFSFLSFVAPTKGESASITVSKFPGEGGGLAANVNRWRDKVGLEPLSAAAVAALPEIAIGNEKAILVDADGRLKEKADPEKNRILGAIVRHGDDTYFFKMTGPSALVGQQRAAMDAFLKSIRFDK